MKKINILILAVSVSFSLDGGNQKVAKKGDIIEVPESIANSLIMRDLATAETDTNISKLESNRKLGNLDYKVLKSLLEKVINEKKLEKPENEKKETILEFLSGVEGIEEFIPDTE